MIESTTLEAQLRRFPAFAELELAYQWLARNVRLFQAPVGQELLSGRAPENCFGILEGRSLLHNDPGVRRPLTLALCQPGDLVGWAGLAVTDPASGLRLQVL